MEYFCELDDFAKEIGVQNYLCYLGVFPVEFSCLNLTKENLDTKSYCYSWILSVNSEKEKNNYSILKN